LAAGEFGPLHFVDLLRLRPTLLFSFDVPGVAGAMAVSILGLLAGLMLLFADVSRLRRAVAAGVVFGLTVALAHSIALQTVQTPFQLALSTESTLILIGLAIVPSVPTAWAATHLDRLSGRIGCAIAVAVTLLLVHVWSERLSIELPPVHGDLLTISMPGLLVADVFGGCAMIAILTFVSGLKDRDLASRSAAETRRLVQFQEATLEGLAIHRDSVVLDCNGAFSRIFALPREEITGRQLSALMGVEHPALREALEQPVELTISRPGLEDRSVEIFTRPLEFDGSAALVTAVRDITEYRQVEARVKFLADHDVLTGFANRSLLESRIIQAIWLSKQVAGKMALLYLDLDRFRLVNELVGHAGGDRVLQAVAERLSPLVRNTDTIARIGADEFVVLQPLVQHPQDAGTLARRIIEALAVPYTVDAQSIELGVSIGITLADSTSTASRVLHEAKIALDRAKRTGRGTACFFEPGMDAHLYERRALEQDLRRAIGTSQLRLCYQPQFGPDSMNLHGFEALVRWTHPQRGPISPGDFIPIAEEGGMIWQLGEWVLRAACAECASWQVPLMVAVNVSAFQFRRIELVEVVERALRDTGLPPHRLELELTEGVFLEDTEQAREMMCRLKELGVRMALDDFGAGYASLSYLRDFPFDRIKIDRSFVGRMQDRHEDLALLRGIVGLGHALGLEVVAEGVETPAQLMYLRDLSCDLIQGYLVGRPVESLQVRGLIDSTWWRIPAPEVPAVESVQQLA
jgi:diguanylate cyclase (GGDEF)-like protein